MKTIRIAQTLLLATSVFFMSCQDKQDSQEKLPKEKYNSALTTMFPGVSDVNWTAKGDYGVANFTYNGNNTKVWFTDASSSQWQMTETEVKFADIPEAVKNSFMSSDYKTWTLEEVDMLARNGNALEPIYAIEVKNGAQELDLYYSEDGVLIKSLADSESDDNESVLPPTSDVSAAIKEYIAQKYPTAKIVEVDIEATGTEVDIVAEGVKKELLFDNTSKWVYTKMEVEESELPAAVTAAVAASSYASHQVDDIDLYETAKGSYYIMELDSPEGEVDIKITIDGTISVVDKETDDDTNNGSMINSEVAKVISEKYPQATIDEYDYSEGYLIVEITDGEIEKDICFNGANKWVSASWDILESELPAAVSTTITSKYPGYAIDDVEYVETATGNYYIVELEKEDEDVEIEVKIAADGNVVI